MYRTSVIVNVDRFRFTTTGFVFRPSMVPPGASQNVPLSKRPLVKTSSNWSKRPQTRKKDWSKRPHKTSLFFRGNFSKKYGILTKKKLVLVTGTSCHKLFFMKKYACVSVNIDYKSKYRPTFSILRVCD